MMLSPNFSLAELCTSQTADRLGIGNNPSDFAIANLMVLCRGLEAIRAIVDKPVIVTSGFRCLELNAAVGSKPGSQHVLGQAADIICPQYGDPKTLIKTLMAVKLDYDQAILEFYVPATYSTPARGWVHVSFVRSEPRKQALVIDPSGTRAYA